MNREVSQYDLEEFKMSYPLEAERLVYIFEYDEYLVAELDDGEVIRYDLILKVSRWFDNVNAAICKTNPQTEEEWRVIFSKKLYRQMRKRALNQLDLALKTRISEGTIARYINGKVTPSAFNVNKLAEALDCSSDYLIDL